FENSAQDAPVLGGATGGEMTAKDGRKFFFAADRRLESMRDPQGNTLAIVRDGASRIHRVTHSSGKEIDFARDGAPPANDGLLRRVTDPLGHSTAFSYGSRGNAISITD